MPFGNSGLESQRDSIIQPRVATKELPWVNAPTMIYPKGVASSPRFSANLNFRKALGPGPGIGKINFCTININYWVSGQTDRLVGMNMTFRAAGLAIMSLVSFTGCVAIKNAAPEKPQASLISQWQPRYSSSVCVRIPTLEEVDAMTNRWERQANIHSASLDAYRLARILSECRLFKEVTVSSIADVATNVLVIQALRNDPPVADPNDPWLMLYGGVIPIYRCFDESVRFRFLPGSRKEFVFPWKERSLVGVWAPVVAAVGPGWHLRLTVQCPVSESQYWSALRSALIEEMDRTDASIGAGTACRRS